MKLYLTLDNEKGNKIERVYEINKENLYECYSWCKKIESMFETMEKVEQESKDEELANEAKRLSQHSD